MRRSIAVAPWKKLRLPVNTVHLFPISIFRFPLRRTTPNMADSAIDVEPPIEANGDSTGDSMNAESAGDNADTQQQNGGSTENGAAHSSSQAEHVQNPWKNYNVLLSLVLCVVSGVADSIWGSVVLSGFLLAMAKSMGRSATANTLVGTAEAVQGLTQLVTALPVGYVADVWGKAKVVRVGAVLMMLTIAITLWTLWDIVIVQDRNSEAVSYRSYIILVVALGLWGIVSGISFGPSQALYADSISQGKRSEMLTYLYSLYLVSSAVGPIVSIILILTVSGKSEDWSMQQIFPIFFVGVCLEIPAALVMLFFSEKYVVPENETDEEGEATRPSESTSNDLSQPLLTAANEDPSTDEEVPSDAETSERAGSRNAQTIVPVVLFVSSLVVSLGSGASVKYFPLFFKEVGFSNAEVQGIFLAVPLVISMLSFAAQKLGTRLGRVEATLVFDSVGVSLLFFMTWLSEGIGEGGGPTLRHSNPWKAFFIVAVYLLRTAIMNCSYPLLESILMDVVPSNQRARWKSLESIASFGWTGSALVGGILSDRHSYQFTFSITATLQLVGAFIILPIRTMVKPEEPQPRQTDGGETD